MALHADLPWPSIRYARRLSALGDAGALCGRTYSAPRKWKRGKGRVTVQMGCCYNYATDKDGHPPGILPHEPVCGMPPFLHDIIDRMCERGIFDATTRPDSCIINFYSEGDCIPPHIDHTDFTRPFVTLSLCVPQPRTPDLWLRMLPCCLATLLPALPPLTERSREIENSPPRALGGNHLIASDWI